MGWRGTPFRKRGRSISAAFMRGAGLLKWQSGLPMKLESYFAYCDQTAPYRPPARAYEATDVRSFRVLKD